MYLHGFNNAYAKRMQYRSILCIEFPYTFCTLKNFFSSPYSQVNIGVIVKMNNQHTRQNALFTLISIVD